MQHTNDAFNLLSKSWVKCLDDGFVELVDCDPRCLNGRSSIEYAIARAARISCNRTTLPHEDDDNRLIRFLYHNKHTSPFEAVSFTFHIRCPLMVRSQLVRHRTFKFNEVSQRYTAIKESFFRPSEYSIRKQGGTNKQGSQEDQDFDSYARPYIKELEEDLKEIFTKYHKLLEIGVAREQARFCLPQATYTELYIKADLHNLLHFLRLRMSSEAQAETREYANAMYKLIRPLIPLISSLLDEEQECLTLRPDEMAAIRSNSELNTSSRSRQESFRKKKKALGLE